MSEVLRNGCGRVVCFDLGGVVVRICRSWEQACRVAGVEVRGDGRLGPAARRALEDVVWYYQIGALDQDQFVNGCSRALHGLYSPAEILAVHESWLLGEYDGVASIVRSLAESGVTTAVLSNTNEIHWRIMADYPALKPIKHALASHLLRVAKPDAKAYQAVEQATGVTSDGIVYFDDLPANVEAARSLGWRAFQVDPEQCTATQITDALRTV